jgi:hypothetical protein
MRDLRRARRHADKLARARGELGWAILLAHRSGESVRDIAPHVGMSPSRVFELLKEAERVELVGDPAGRDA